MDSYVYIIQETLVSKSREMKSDSAISNISPDQTSNPDGATSKEENKRVDVSVDDYASGSSTKEYDRYGFSHREGKTQIILDIDEEIERKKEAKWTAMLKNWNEYQEKHPDKVIGALLRTPSILICYLVLYYIL